MQTLWVWLGFCCNDSLTTMDYYYYYYYRSIDGIIKWSGVSNAFSILWYSSIFECSTIFLNWFSAPLFSNNPFNWLICSVSAYTHRAHILNDSFVQRTSVHKLNWNIFSFGLFLKHFSFQKKKEKNMGPKNWKLM